MIPVLVVLLIDQPFSETQVLATFTTGADRICVIQNGRIIEEGTHTDLLARLGAYSRLVSRQLAPATSAFQTN